MNQRRIRELDYLKGVLILLVISFHLVYFEQLHPFAKQVVYCFHMPGFLLISGYLMNVSKTPKDFLWTLLWLTIPYIIMESGYIYMASLLPVFEHVDQLTPAVFFDQLLLHPRNTYWYLHDLILCGAVYYFVFRFMQRGLLLKLFTVGLVYYILALFFGILSFSSALYFLAGVAIRQNGTDFLSFFRPNILSVLVFALLVCFSSSPNQASLNGALIAYFAISSLLYAFNLFTFSPFHFFSFLGRNSLMLYVFSPVFTILCKQFVPYLQFDPTGLIFLMFSLVFCVVGSLGIAWMMDQTGISHFFFGRKAIRE